MTAQLPDYSRPPVSEVACGIQFNELSKFKSPHYGVFWEHVKAEYPSIEDHPVLAPLGATTPEPVIFDLPPLRRVFYIHSAGNYLIQLQPSRFHTNWRKLKDTDVYPRFEKVNKTFTENWKMFNQFVSANGIETPQANQYELVYINHILEDKAGTFPVGIEKYFPILALRNSKSGNFLPDPKVATLNLRYDLPDGNGSLFLALKHGSRKNDQKDVVLLEVTARGPAKPDTSNLNEWFALAHDWIVQGFTDFSSAEAHNLWGRIK